MTRRLLPARALAWMLACGLLAACAGQEVDAPAAAPAAAEVLAPAPDVGDDAERRAEPAEPPAEADAAPAGQPVARRPDWLGTRVLPLRPDGFGEIPPTPPELDDRRFAPPASPLPPPDGEEFAATVAAVPDEVAARSTWGPHCPVTLDQLRYLTVTFWGFDGRPHTGELLVHASVADDVAGVFRRIFDARFPLEEVRVIAAHELDLPPTGDGNVTSAFVCRSSVGSGSWSEHASGLALDVNPFHNPYAKGDVVLPELASSYVDRARHRPGMVQPGDEVVRAFADIGWAWGGDWRSAKDWMHFSRSGR